MMELASDKQLAEVFGDNEHSLKSYGKAGRQARKEHLEKHFTAETPKVLLRH